MIGRLPDERTCVARSARRCRPYNLTIPEEEGRRARVVLEDRRPRCIGVGPDGRNAIV